MKKYHVLLDGTRLYRWNGGTDFLANLAAICYSIQRKSKNIDLKVSVMLPYKIPRYESIIRKILGKESRKRNETIDQVFETVKRLSPNIEPIYIRKYDVIKKTEDWSVNRLIKKHHVDCVMGVTSNVYHNLPVPWVSYIPDYQHKYLPQFFGAEACAQRDIQFANIAEIAPYFVATSQMHQSDLMGFSGIAEDKIFTMPFAPLVADAFIDTTDVDVEKYRLPKDYFIISNQFWQHKSHKTAIKALKLLRDEGHTDLEIICTGPTEDNRASAYIDEIWELISELGLEEHFRILGLIPKLEQIEIMKGARALIQPSLFEGDPGGCSTYDAVSLDRPVILSDTRVNLEAKIYEKAHFFAAEDPEDLARQMKKVLQAEHSVYSCEDVCRNRRINEKKQREFFENMIIQICEGKK